MTWPNSCQTIASQTESKEIGSIIALTSPSFNLGLTNFPKMYPVLPAEKEKSKNNRIDWPFFFIYSRQAARTAAIIRFCAASTLLMIFRTCPAAACGSRWIASNRSHN